LKNAVNHRLATAQENIVGITGPPVEAKMIVDILCEARCKGKSSKFVIKDVAKSRYHLFSLTKLMSYGWTISGDKVEGIKVKKGEQVLHFNKTVRTPKGLLYVLLLKRRSAKQQQTCNAGIEQKLVCNEEIAGATGARAITINKAHAMCSHMNHVEICDYYGRDLTKQGFSNVSVVERQSKAIGCYTSK
jgi:hypothetical protein